MPREMAYMIPYALGSLLQKLTRSGRWQVQMCFSSIDVLRVPYLLAVRRMGRSSANLDRPVNPNCVITALECTHIS